MSDADRLPMPASTAAALAPAADASLPAPRCSRSGAWHPDRPDRRRTLFAGYRVLFEGMVSASQTTRTPSLVMKTFLAPPARRDGFRAFQSPLDFAESSPRSLARV